MSISIKCRSGKNDVELRLDQNVELVLHSQSCGGRRAIIGKVTKRAFL